MNTKKKKVYVLRLSKTFLSDHPRRGELTNFKEAFLSGQKIHTIRSGPYWEKAVKEVNEGVAVLSVRQWSAKPYASPDDPELACLESLGWQPFHIKEGLMLIDNLRFRAYNLALLSGNDGLSKVDFLDWFKYPKPFSGGIVHFTDFRY